MENRKTRVAITHGDTNGVGYELIFKTFAEPAMLELCTPIVYGSPKAAAYHRNVLDMQANFTIVGNANEAKEGRVNMLASFDEEVKIEMGQPNADSATAALKALTRATADFGKEIYDALVTAPVVPNVANKSGKNFAGELPFLEEAVGNGQKGMTILVNEKLRIGTATEALPMKDVAKAITKELVAEKIATLHQSLRRDFRISNPRVAVLALNPSEAEGQEEKECIRPAIIEMEKKGIQAFGPFAADEFFGNGLYESFDGVLSMYQQQGSTPFRALDLGNGVRFVAGLPIVCTSPDNVPAIETAGKGTADENAFRQAIYMAIDIARNRASFDEPMKNPLPKLYHEKRDESEKVRFAIPKKHENKPAAE
ncbi:MAG: 4-hydroxythreonine-4-phosphate dehydrogenase PdxA [Prevotella sp.]|nr:4-hydroxythreonine-4-phosphate dehydrogenase PdxA [Prevotella sp.]